MSGGGGPPRHPDRAEPGDESFPARVTERLAALPAVEAVALGGSRATGRHTPDSDWDFAVYYRGPFSPESLRAVGWPGEVSEIGGWGGGVFNGGAWLEVDGRRVDVHYRDLAEVEHQLSEARQGRFHVERLLFHLAGIPSYLLAAELAVNQVLHGHLERPDYPEPLKHAAHRRWSGEARATLSYARAAFAAHGRATECAGAMATAACQAAHAVLAARGEWITNEKTLLDRAGLRPIDALLTTLSPQAQALTEAVDRAAAILEAAMD